MSSAPVPPGLILQADEFMVLSSLQPGSSVCRSATGVSVRTALPTRGVPLVTTGSLRCGGGQYIAVWGSRGHTGTSTTHWGSLNPTEPVRSCLSRTVLRPCPSLAARLHVQSLEARLALTPGAQRCLGRATVHAQTSFPKGAGPGVCLGEASRGSTM